MATEIPERPCYCREDDDGFTVVLDTSDCPQHHWERIR